MYRANVKEFPFGFEATITHYIASVCSVYQAKLHEKNAYWYSVLLASNPEWILLTLGTYSEI